MTFRLVIDRVNPTERFRLAVFPGVLLLAIFTWAGATPGMTAEPGRITGRVSFQGKSVSHALVIAVSERSTRKSSLTDSNGVYLMNIDAGTYLLTVVHPQYVVDDGGFGCKLTDVKSGVSLSIDFSLTNGGVISGTVNDGNGEPLPGEPVFYENADRSFAKPCLMAGQAEARTDDQGAFRIFGLPPGKYTVGVGRQERQALGKPPGPFRTTYYPGLTEKNRAEVINVLPGEESKLKKFQVVASLHGFAAEVSSKDRDSGEPLPAMDFDVIKLVNGTALSKTALKTDATGSVKIRNLDPGEYKILSPVRNGEALLKDCSPVSFKIADQDLDDIVIRCGGAGLSISGRVTIDQNAAATELDCAIALKEGDDLLGSGSPTFGVKLDPQGSFMISGLQKTVYTLVILPLKPSLQYEYAKVDGRVFRDPQIFGKLTLDMRTEIKTITINLARR